MISLLVEEYCHECHGFSADVHREGSNTLIVCEYAGRCAAIARYLKNKAKVGEKDA